MNLSKRDLFTLTQEELDSVVHFPDIQEAISSIQQKMLKHKRAFRALEEVEQSLLLQALEKKEPKKKLFKLFWSGPKKK